MIGHHEAVERRGPGHPKGLGRVPGSGRAKGTPNRTTAELREQITAAKPVEFLCAVAEGRRIRVGPQAGPQEAIWAYPSIEQRIKASELLVRKILPDLTAAELTGPGGAPLVRAQVVDVRDIAATAIELLERARARREPVVIEGAAPPFRTGARSWSTPSKKNSASEDE